MNEYFIEPTQWVFGENDEDTLLQQTDILIDEIRQYEHMSNCIIPLRWTSHFLQVYDLKDTYRLWTIFCEDLALISVIASVIKFWRLGQYIENCNLKPE